MITITADASDKVLKLMPREAEINYYIITDKETNVSTQVNSVGQVFFPYYTQLTITNANYAFTDGHRYVLKAYNLSDELIYHDLIFSTSKSLTTNQTFNINENKYTENTTTNEYEIYES